MGSVYGLYLLSNFSSNDHDRMGFSFFVLDGFVDKIEIAVFKFVFTVKYNFFARAIGRFSCAIHLVQDFGEGLPLKFRKCFVQWLFQYCSRFPPKT
ncbi:hypothetical protein D3C85_1275750 [compost metagenome]